MLVRVPFADVDMHGHVHNGQYFSYVESAINEYIRCHDLGALFDPSGNTVVYHVKKVEIRYDGATGKPVPIPEPTRQSLATGDR